MATKLGRCSTVKEGDTYNCRQNRNRNLLLTQGKEEGSKMGGDGTAGEKKGKRLYYVMQALCSTGIRVSELPFITVEAVKRKRARVHLKGKSRWVLLPTKLCAQLKAYAARRGIREGSIFVTGSGKPLDRSNILHEMKSVCREAKVERGKVFPHNLRHLFACTYYDREKDLTHLADLLGHSSVNTTRIYTRVSGEEQVKQIDGLGLVKEGRKKTA